jgi:hypothetical protein
MLGTRPGLGKIAVGVLQEFVVGAMRELAAQHEMMQRWVVYIASAFVVVAVRVPGHRGLLLTRSGGWLFVHRRLLAACPWRGDRGHLPL